MVLVYGISSYIIAPAYYAILALIVDIPYLIRSQLMHRSRMTHTCCHYTKNVIDSDNGLVCNLFGTIIWTSICILSIGPLRTNFSEN